MKRTRSLGHERGTRIVQSNSGQSQFSRHGAMALVFVVLTMIGLATFVAQSLLSVSASIVLEPPPCTPATTLRISEFRLRGAAGPNDEFIEFYNNSDSQISVCTADGSNGWALAARNAAGTAASIILVIPNGTVIPGRRHLLATNTGSNGYSLSSHPAGSGATATGDLNYTTDIEDNSGIALFLTSNPANFITANRSDAAGFSGATGAIPDLYREGAGLSPIGTANGDFTFARKMTSASGGLPQDSGANESDFLFLSTTGGTFGGIQTALGAPGPENLTSPVQSNSLFGFALLDPTVSANSTPNRERNTTSGNNSTFGTLALRRTVTNYTGASATRLRFRIVDITTFPAPGTADVRAITSSTFQVTVQGVTRTVQGTTVEQPPTQAAGGGWNSTMSVGAVSLAEPLAPGASVDVNFLLGVQKTGSFRFYVNIEALADSSTARLDPMNQTGGGTDDPLSRNSGWSIPILGLPGRSGLDLNLSLAYNSLATWTKKGSSIFFNDDRGFPAPGFRLGFPVIQPAFFNSQAGKSAFMLIAPDGARVELRQVGTGTLYQSVDSSYLLLDANTMTLRASDGTQLSYSWTESGDYVCTQIKDRNGNFITVNYDGLGRIDTIVDTLARTMQFNYTGADLTSITQTWTVNGQQQPTHTWAAFTYADQTIQTNFTGLSVVGPPNGSTVRVLTKVVFADNSHVDFDYTSWGQVWKIRQYAPGDYLLNYRSYNLPLDSSTPQTDCPRFTERRDWAKNWNLNQSGVEQEAITYFTAPTPVTIPGTSLTGTLAQITAPDGTSQKIYYGSAATTPGWQNGLVLLTESYDSSPTKQRWTSTTWTQDEAGVSYRLNPRVTETNVFDPAGNRARTRVDYASFNLPAGTTCHYPQDTYEYGADASTVLRRTRTEYKMEAPYTNNDRRILGLPSARYLCDGMQGETACTDTSGASLLSKVTFQYDETGSIQGNDAPVQHDNTNYTAAFVAGRGNLSSVKRYDVINAGQFTVSSVHYNTSGAVVKSIDASGHATQISYTDQFAANGTTLDSGLPLTLAYPTTVTDPDGYTAKSRYNYQFGAPTWKQTPLPNVTDNQPGPQQIIEYDSIGRLQKVSSLVNNAYTRFIYGPNYVQTFATVNNVADEAHSLQVFDGHGRVIGKANNHPGSVGGFSGQLTVFDAMSRAIKESNPTETSVTVNGTPINPFAWVAAGDDAAAGWLYTQQTYDWKGRPRITTNVDGTYKEASYNGCGCAGGEIVTLTDEGTLSAGVAKRRQQKIYSDVLGRAWKTEVLNWEGGSVYSTSVSVFNARDQVKVTNQYAGSAPTEASSTNENVSCPDGTCQKTALAYDGFGRLQTKHVPEQNAGTATVYAYNPDDTIQSVIDARGASATYVYNNGRHLVNEIHYSAPSGITPTANVTFGYDAAANRISMNDGIGALTYGYDQLSRMTSETRQFNDPIPQAPLPNSSFAISYEYNLAGNLQAITAPYGERFNYNVDDVGRITGVTGPLSSWATGPKSYISNIKYRAFGGIKSADFPNAEAFWPGCLSMSLSQTFDDRLRAISYDLRHNPSQYCAVGSILKKQYDYFADNRLSYVRDVLNGGFDRSQEYDQAGRLIRVRTAAEAQGTGSLNFYRQDFAYDEFANTLSRQVTTPNSAENQTYTYSNNRATSWVNNQPTPWQYDADGRVTNDTHTQYSNDASGTVIGTHVPNEYVMGRSHDGDGLVAKQAVGETTTGVPLYLVRSSVLGGQIITQLPANAANGTPRTFVYGFGKLLAKVEKTNFNGTWEIVLFQFRDPSETTHLDDEGGYYMYRRMELDPTKAVVYDDYNPEAPPYSGGYLDTWTLGFLGVGGSQFGGASCFLDGFEANCGTVMRSLALDMADPCPSIDCGPAVAVIRRRDGSSRRALVPLSRDPNTGELGYYPERWGIIQDTVKVEVIRDAWARAERNYEDCQRNYPSDIPLEAAKQIVRASLLTGVPMTLMSVTWRHEGSFSLSPNSVARYNDKGLINGYDVGPLQASTNYYNKSPFTDGLADETNPFGSAPALVDLMTKVGRQQALPKRLKFDGDSSRMILVSARAFTMDILPRARGRNQLHRYADAAGMYRGPADYRGRYNQYLSEAPRDKDFLDCLFK